MYKVLNRSSSQVIYNIPELSIRREFAPGETKNISYEELEKLYYVSGGANLMANYLLVQDAEVLEKLDMKIEPEYNFTEKEVIDLIKNKSLNAFLDALDFAPVGVIDMIKDLSVKLPLTDYEKQKALKEKTGFDVNKAIVMSEEDSPAQPTEKVRRETVKEPTSGRRETPNYKVVSKEQ